MGFGESGDCCGEVFEILGMDRYGVPDKVSAKDDLRLATQLGSVFVPLFVEISRAVEKIGVLPSLKFGLRCT